MGRFREGIHPTIHYKWLKDLMEAGKARMRGDTVHEANSDEVKALAPGERATEAVGTAVLSSAAFLFLLP